MNDPLSPYRKKRDPGSTNEPFSAEQAVRDEQGNWSGRFVIHQHAATRMHYDLRLQIGSTLQSFAIPRGLSLDPSSKHLAIHTEDHPLEYLFFEDVIPEGNYGAGAMIVWDTGGFQFIEANGQDSLSRGKLDFVLDGFKAKGRFALIATGRRKAATGLAGTSGAAAEWLLIKKKDQHSQEGLHLAETSPLSVMSGLSVQQLLAKEAFNQSLLQEAETLHKAHPPRSRKKHSPLSLVPFTPMVCTNEAAPKNSPKYLYELKLDGVRIVADKLGQDVRLHYRSKNPCSRNYADIVRALRHLTPHQVVLDGEIVSFDAQGRPNFEALAPRIRGQKAEQIQKAEALTPVVYLVFDLLQLGPHDLSNVPLEKRKALLKRLLPGSGYVRFLDHIVEQGDALWALCEAQDLEGMVAKRLGTAYQFGPQSTGHWIKLKRETDHDLVVVGYTQSERGELKSLCLASYSDNGLIYRGRVGSGFSNKERIALSQTLQTLKCDEAALSVPQEVAMIAVAPRLVVKVRAQGFSEAGHLRAAVYLGIHESKAPQDCDAAPRNAPSHEEQFEEQLEQSNTALSPSLDDAVPNQAAQNQHWQTGSRVRFSHLDKLYFPDDGFTKGDMLRYYAQIAPIMLPHLQGRPVVLVRYPDGITGKNFYQWRIPDKSPDWLRSVELYDEEKKLEKGSGKAAFLIDSRDALLHIANLGCIPLHVLASREGTRQSCDFLTIDFDLGQRAFADAVRLALSLREILDELGLESFPKTSGQRGLHVLIPLGPKVQFESAKLLCELLGRLVVGRHADIATMERRIEKRGDKVYVDTGQTGRSRTIVAPYSVRAYPGARVSTPLRWEEIHLALDPAIFTIESVVRRVEKHGDPMKGFLDQTPDLQAALNKLARWTS